MTEPSPFAAQGLHDPHPAGLIRQERLFAGVAGRRFLAWVADNIAIAGLTFLALVLTGFLAVFFLAGLWLVIGFAYRWFALSRSSATPGMRLMGLVLVDRHQGPDGAVAMTLLDRPVAFWHTAVYSLSMAFALPQILSVALILFTREHRSLSDIVTGTAAVNQDALW